MAEDTNSSNEAAFRELEIAELDDSQLEEVVGGIVIRKMKRCPYCGSKRVTYRYSTNGTARNYWKCKVCQKTW